MKFSVKCLISAVAVAGLNSQASAFTAPKAFGARLAIKLDATTLDEWQLLDNGSVVGSVRGHPTLNDGDIITTSPIANPRNARNTGTVTTLTGSKYQLGTPMQLKRNGSSQVSDGPGMDRGTLLKGAGLASLIAGGFALGVGVGGNVGGNSMTVPEVSYLYISGS
jgi:hypothetical protein